MGPGVIFLLNKLLKTGVQKNNLSPLSVTRLSIWARYNHLAIEKPDLELSFCQTQGQKVERGGRERAIPRREGFRDWPPHSEAPECPDLGYVSSHPCTCAHVCTLVKRPTCFCMLPI